MLSSLSRVGLLLHRSLHNSETVNSAYWHPYSFSLVSSLTIRLTYQVKMLRYCFIRSVLPKNFLIELPWRSLVRVTSCQLLSFNLATTVLFYLICVELYIVNDLLVTRIVVRLCSMLLLIPSWHVEFWFCKLLGIGCSFGPTNQVVHYSSSSTLDSERF